MKRKLVALLVNVLVDLLLGAFSLVFRLKDDGPGTPVTNFRELAEALAREGSIVAPAIRPADIPSASGHLLLPQNPSRGTEAASLY
jgi:hypothetical protein